MNDVAFWDLYHRFSDHTLTEIECQCQKNDIISLNPFPPVQTQFPVPELHGDHPVLSSVLHIGAIESDLLEVEVTADREAADHVVDDNVHLFNILIN